MQLQLEQWLWSEQRVVGSSEPRDWRWALDTTLFPIAKLVMIVSGKCSMLETFDREYIQLILLVITSNLHIYYNT